MSKITFSFIYFCVPNGNGMKFHSNCRDLRTRHCWTLDKSLPINLAVRNKFLLSFDGKSSEPLPTTLEEMSQEFGMETCWICLMGREKGVRIREKDGCDKEYQVTDTEIRQTISETIDECLYKNFGSFFQKEHSIASSPLLVGFTIVLTFGSIYSLQNSCNTSILG